MYARIKYQNKVYYSYIFACFEFDYMNKYVVYDSIDNKFDIISYFSKKCDGVRQVGIINENKKDFVFVDELKLNMGVVKKCFGYSWLINNVEFIKDIEEGKPINEHYVNLAKEMNLSIMPDAWNEIITEDDANDLMNRVDCFHDWYLISIEAISNPYEYDFNEKVILKFSSEDAFDCLLEFEKCLYLKYNFSSANRIYLSSIVLDKENKYWINGKNNIKVEDIEKHFYIKGNKLRWKFVANDENW